MRRELFIETLAQNILLVVFFVVSYYTGKSAFNVVRKSQDKPLSFKWYIAPYYLVAGIVAIFTALFCLTELTVWENILTPNKGFVMCGAWAITWLVVAWMKVGEMQIAFRSDYKRQKWIEEHPVKETKDPYTHD